MLGIFLYIYKFMGKRLVIIWFFFMWGCLFFLGIFLIIFTWLFVGIVFFGEIREIKKIVE